MPPLNDDFADAIVLSGPTLEYDALNDLNWYAVYAPGTVSTVGATGEPDEPIAPYAYVDALGAIAFHDPSDFHTGGSVWYRWRTPQYPCDARIEAIWKQVPGAGAIGGPVRTLWVMGYIGSGVSGLTVVPGASGWAQDTSDTSYWETPWEPSTDHWDDPDPDKRSAWVLYLTNTFSTSNPASGINMRAGAMLNIQVSAGAFSGVWEASDVYLRVRYRPLTPLDDAQFTHGWGLIAE